VCCYPPVSTFCTCRYAAFCSPKGSVSVGDNREMVGPLALGGSGLSSNADGLHGHITAAQRSHWFLLAGSLREQPVRSANYFFLSSSAQQELSASPSGNWTGVPTARCM